MTEVATELMAEPNIPAITAQIGNPSGYIRYLIAMTLIAFGGIFTVVWTALLGWAAGKVFSLW